MSKELNFSRKVAVILGPTASGKTKLGVELARKFSGEIINADSRQVYKGMDVGTGKDLNEYRIKEVDENGRAITIDIPYHLIDIVHPNTVFSLAKYQKAAFKKIREMLGENKLPIMVGGTGLYIQAVVEGFNLSGAPPDKKEREKMKNKSEAELFRILNRINPDFASRVNESDKQNKQRLIRYIEICRAGKEGVGGKKGSPYDFLLLGVAPAREELDKRIYDRLVERLEKEGMVEEVRRLHYRQRVSWKRLKQLGLEYRYISRYLQGEIGYEDMVEKLYIAIRQFSKRQMTWFRQWEKKGADIHWSSSFEEAAKLVDKFLFQ